MGNWMTLPAVCAPQSDHPSVLNRPPPGDSERPEAAIQGINGARCVFAVSLSYQRVELLNIKTRITVIRATYVK